MEIVPCLCPTQPDSDGCIKYGLNVLWHTMVIVHTPLPMQQAITTLSDEDSLK